MAAEHTAEVQRLRTELDRLAASHREDREEIERLRAELAEWESEEHPVQAYERLAFQRLQEKKAAEERAEQAEADRDRQRSSAEKHYAESERLRELLDHAEARNAADARHIEHILTANTKLKAELAAARAKLAEMYAKHPEESCYGPSGIPALKAKLATLREQLTERDVALDRAVLQLAEAQAQLREIAKDCGRPDTVHPHSAVRVRLGELSVELAAAREAAGAVASELQNWAFDAAHYGDPGDAAVLTRLAAALREEPKP